MAKPPDHDLAPPPEESAAAPTTEPHAPVAVPPKGEGRSWTIDDRLGYRKEDSPDRKRRQIRFAGREGGEKPDDGILDIVRERKPHLKWSSMEKAGQGRNSPDGLGAIYSADQKSAELGRKRTGRQER